MKKRFIKSLPIISAIYLSLSSQLFAGDAKAIELPSLEKGSQRCTGSDLKLTSIPESLAGFKCYPLERGSATKPGRGTSVQLNAPAEVYLAVMQRGKPTIDPSWEKTNLTLKWSIGKKKISDVIYKKAAQAGQLEVPVNNGKLKKQYGIPNLLIVPASIQVASTTGESVKVTKQKTSKSTAAKASDGKERPSVLFLNIDDWNDWNGVLKGHPQAITPNLDRFAEKSLAFTRAICPSPMCFPSRAAIFSGLHPSRTGAKSNSGGKRGWRAHVPDAVTLPKLFSNNGWWSVGIGKNIHGPCSDEFDEVFGSGGREPKTVPGTKFSLNASGTWGVADVPTSKMPDYRKVSEGIESLKSKENGLFLALGIYRPHVPWVVPQEYFDKYPLDTLIMPKTIENDLDDLPERFKSLALNVAKFGADYHKNAVAKGHDKDMVRAYLACVTFADEQVGRILDAWYASTHAKNGYVFLWSDHGFQLSEKGGWSKMKPWFDSAHVNLMIAGPGLPKGEFCHRAVSLIDLYPTLVDLLKLPAPPQGFDGKSLLPLLKNPQQEWDKPVLMSSEIDGIRYDVVMDNDYRMTQLTTGETELYKLATDPHEFNNLADNPEYEQVMTKLSKHVSFGFPALKDDGWVEAEKFPHQTSSDFKQRGNYHYPESVDGASQGKVVCADLRKGEGCYLEFVVNIDNPGDYKLSVAASAQGDCTLLTAPVVDDAKQADAGYPMKKLMDIPKSSDGSIKTLSAGTVTFDKAGLQLLRFSSKVSKQILRVDRIQLRKL